MQTFSTASALLCLGTLCSVGRTFGADVCTMLLSACHRLVILMILFTTIAITFVEINWYLTAPNKKFMYLENSLDSISETLIPAQYLSTTTNAASYWRLNKDKNFEIQEGRLSSEVLIHWVFKKWPQHCREHPGCPPSHYCIK